MKNTNHMFLIKFEKDKSLKDLEFILNDNVFYLSEKMAEYFTAKNYKTPIQIFSYLNTYRSICSSELGVELSDIDNFINKLGLIIFPDGVPELKKYSFGVIK